jgi:hypothetical protein
MRLYLLYISTFLLLLALPDRSQGQLSYPELEKESLLLIEKEAWTDLLRLTRRSLRQGLDYKNLRLRKGIALYEKKRYLRSAFEFDRTLQFDQGDTLVQEYLYFAYLNAGMKGKARYEAAGFTERLREKLGIQKSRPFNSLYLEGGYRWSTLPDAIRPLTYFSLTVDHHLGWKWQFVNNLSFLNLTIEDLRFNQLDIYMQLQGQVSPAVTLRPYFHYIYVSGNFTGLLRDQPLGTSFDWQIRQHGLLAGSALNIQARNWQISPEVSVMALPTRETDLTPTPRMGMGPAILLAETVDSLFWQVQAGAKLAYQTPWRFSAGAGIYAIYNEKQELRWMPTAQLLLTPFDGFSLSAEYFYEPGQYASMQSGFLLDNVPTYHFQKSIISMGIRFSSTLQWITTYQWEERQLNTRYQTHSIFTGLKIKL